MHLIDPEYHEGQRHMINQHHHRSIIERIKILPFQEEILLKVSKEVKLQQALPCCSDEEGKGHNDQEHNPLCLGIHYCSVYYLYKVDILGNCPGDVQPKYQKYN